MADEASRMMELINAFRQGVGAQMIEIFALAEEPEQALLCRLLAAEAASLAAALHAGDRDTFLRLALDAFAIVRTGEVEQ